MNLERESGRGFGWGFGKVGNVKRKKDWKRENGRGGEGEE